MKEIILNKGLSTYVDEEDYEKLSKYRWTAGKGYKRHYAIRYTGSRWNKQTIFMHREILQPGKHEIVDHIDGDGLNNQRENIRICTKAENSRNRIKHIIGKSAYKGVSFTQDGRWAAIICSKVIGYFNTEQEAAISYDNAAKERFREFANLNMADRADHPKRGFPGLLPLIF